MGYEEKLIKGKGEKGEDFSKVNISILKYFWQLSFFSGRSERVLPKFLRKRSFLKNFSDNELRILSRYLHRRRFNAQEIIFKQGDVGVGLYFIFSGQVDMLSDGSAGTHHVVTLNRGDIFGELAFCQERTIRTATAVSKQGCELLGVFKPDLEEMIDYHPAIGARLLQSVSVVIADRLSSVALEMRELKHKFANEEAGENHASN